MKVLQLGKFYPAIGGLEKVMYDITMGLSEKKERCDILCTVLEKHDRRYKIERVCRCLACTFHQESGGNNDSSRHDIPLAENPEEV